MLFAFILLNQGEEFGITGSWSMGLLLGMPGQPPSGGQIELEAVGQSSQDGWDHDALEFHRPTVNWALPFRALGEPSM